MHIRLKYFTHILAINVALGGIFPVETALANSPFYKNNQEGWYFYNEEVPEEPTEDRRVAPPVSPPPKQKETTREPVAREVIPESLSKTAAVPLENEKLTVAKMKELLPVYMNAALDNPSPANVTRYFLLQKLAMDKASKFSEIAQRVTTANPMLDENTRRPTGSFIANEMNVRAADNRDALLAGMKSRKVALWFFYDPTDKISQKQAGVVEAFKKKHNMLVVPIASKDIPLPNDILKNYKVNTDQMQTLGIKALPSFYLVQLPNRFIPIGQGGLSLEDMQERTMLASVRTGIISEREFESTQAFNDVNDLADLDLNDLTVGVTSDPEKFAAYMKRKMEQKR